MTTISVWRRSTKDQRRSRMFLNMIYQRCVRKNQKTSLRLLLTYVTVVDETCMNLHTTISENIYLNVSNICDHYGQYMYDSSHNNLESYVLVNPLYQ